ncbi:MauE/DoxX family redox-associated membrane protein [Streptomyces massasporeus]
MTYVAFACRILLFGVFLLALAGKVRSRTAFASFARSITDLRLFPRKVSRAAAAAVIAGEVAVLLLLVPPRTAHLGLAAAVLLLLAFTAGIVVALRGGRRAPCRCFGASATPLGPLHVVRNLILAGTGAAGFAVMTALPAGGWPAHAGGGAVAAVAAIVAALLVARLDDLAALFRTGRPAPVAARPRAVHK